MKNILKIIIVFFISALFLIKSEYASAGAMAGLTLCEKTIIPSLFPFMVIAGLVSGFPSLPFGEKIGDKLTGLIFNQSSCSLPIILLSLTGGFPVGAKMISDSYKSKKISLNEAQRLIIFCFGAGPGFFIVTVGEGMLNSKKAGIILLISSVLSSLITGFFTRFFAEKSDKSSFQICPSEGNFSPAEAVTSGIKSIAGVCGWVLIFSALMGVVGSFALPPFLKTAVSLFSEVTSACTYAAGKYPLPIISFILSWGGLAVHMQISSYLSDVSLTYVFFASGRIFIGIISSFITYVILHFFPCELNVSSISGGITPVAVSVSVPSAFAMLLLFSLIILDLAPEEKV